MRALMLVIAWAAASLTTYVLAAAANQNVALNRLMEIGAPMPLDVRLSSTLHAILHMGGYWAVIMIGFAIAFAVASLLRPKLPALAPIAYPLAGAVAIITALEMMRRLMGLHIIMGAQDVLSYVSQVAAGALGGWMFNSIRNATRRA